MRTFALSISYNPIKKIMRTIFIQVVIVCLSVSGFAQNINFQEDTTANNLYDSRQGSCAIADIDNDGDLDLIITGADAGLANRKTTLYSNDGQGNFTEITDTGLSNNTEGGDIEFADVDGDGDLDLMLTGRDGSPVYYADFYFNDGSGNFTLEPNTPFEGTVGGDVDFEDIDNDGDLDVFMCGWDNNNTVFSKLYVNDGTGNFTVVASTSIEGGFSSAFFDKDNDNDMDLIVTGVNNNDEKKTSLYENDGSGNFSLVSNTPFIGVENSNICAGDSDGDGDIDLLLNGMNDNFEYTCQLYLNDGTGSFSLLEGTPFIKTFAGTVDFADFDNDDDMDILVTGSAGGADFAAHIYENQGMNNFGLVDSLIEVYISTTAIGDIDSDNDLDIIIVGISNEPDFVKPRVYRNLLTTTSIEMASEGSNDNILIYPNPSEGVINIDTEHTSASSISIYNSTGELVYSDDNFNSASQIQLNQAPGFYMVVFENNNLISRSKLVLR